MDRGEQNRLAGLDPVLSGGPVEPARPEPRPEAMSALRYTCSAREPTVTHLGVRLPAGDLDAPGRGHTLIDRGDFSRLFAFAIDT